jgi:GTP-binding protein YchF
MVSVPDARLERLAELLGPPKITPTVMEFVDIAGLVHGASRGEGLGNTFLGHIREVDAVVHILRCFHDPDVVHVDGAIDPLRDLSVVETELILADLETVERRIAKVEKAAKTGDKNARREWDICLPLRENLGKGLPVRHMRLPEESVAFLGELHLITAKKVLYVANVGEAELKGDHGAIAAVRQAATREGAPLVVICGNLEAEIAELPPDERQAFLADLGLLESGLHQLIRAGYALLDLVTFYTIVGTELRAWTIPRGTRAPQAAGKIHSDMERGFIRAEVIACDRFLPLGSLAAAREKGALRSEGRDYLIADGDIVTFRFNV